MRTLRAAQHMAAQLCTAAAFDGGHDLELAQAQMAGMCFTPCGTLGTEDVRHLDRAGHPPGQSGGSIDKASSGLWVSRKVVVAT